MATKNQTYSVKRIDGSPTKARIDAKWNLSVPFREVKDHMDAGESAFTALALSYVEPYVYETLLPPMKGRQFVEVDLSTPPGAISTRYRMFTRTGVANFVTNSTNDYPTGSFFVKEYAHNFARIGMSFRYSLHDLAAAALASQNGGPAINIDLESALAVREAIERKLDYVAGFGSTAAGDPTLGLVGIINLPNANVYALANGAAGTTPWATKTPDEVIADLVGIKAAQVAATYERFVPKKYLLPISQHETLAGRSMGDGRSDTILSYFLRTQRESGNEITCASWHYLTNPVGDSLDMMIAYDPNPRYIRHMMSRDFFQYPPDIRGSKVEVECDAQTAGVISPYPLSVSQASGV